MSETELEEVKRMAHGLIDELAHTVERKSVDDEQQESVIEVDDAA